MLRAVEELNIKYDTEKKEMQISSLEEEKRLMTRLSVAVGGLLLLGLAVLFFHWRWMIQKKRIAEQQQQLAEQQVKQLEQEKQLSATQAVFDGEVKERSRLARDLHDGLSGKLTSMKISLQELKQIAEFDDNNQEQYNIVMETLNDSVQELRRVSHNLMPLTLSRSGLKAAVRQFVPSHFSHQSAKNPPDNHI
jgi:signal transduction histidine kinase